MANYLYRRPGSNVTNIVAEPTQFYAQQFLAVSTSVDVTVTGIVLSLVGNQIIPAAFSGTVKASNGTNAPRRWSDLTGQTFNYSAQDVATNLPAVGIIAKFSAAVYMGDDQTSVTDMTTNFARYPQIPGGVSFRFGEVNEADYPDAISIVAGVNAAFAGGTLVLGPGESFIGKTGKVVTTVAVEFTRPADTTPYAALDVVGPAVTGVQTLSNILRIAGGTGKIIYARVQTDNNAVTPRLRLQIYNTAPTAIADNSPFTLLYANRLIRQPTVSLSAMFTEGTGSDSSMTENALINEAVTGVTRDLYLVVETLDAFTPASGQKFTITISVESD